MAGGRVNDRTHLRRIVRSSTKIEEYEPGDPGAWDEAYTKFIELKEMHIV
jgi:hypothetical protein